MLGGVLAQLQAAAIVAAKLWGMTQRCHAGRGEWWGGANEGEGRLICVLVGVRYVGVPLVIENNGRNTRWCHLAAGRRNAYSSMIVSTPMQAARRMQLRPRVCTRALTSITTAAHTTAGHGQRHGVPVSIQPWGY